MTIKTADTVKITGQSLKGRNLILNPVNNETNASTTKPMAESKYTAFDTEPEESTIVTNATRTPIKISETPSTIHSIVMIR